VHQRPARCLIAALLVVLALPASAGAANQLVTAAAGNVLSISVSPTVAAAGTLAAGQTLAFTPTPIGIVAPSGSWSLTASGSKLAKVSANPACDNSAPSLNSALNVWSAATVGPLSTSVSGDALSASGSSPTILAVGSSLSDTVSVTFKQPVDSAEQLAAGCVYNTTVTYTLSPA
jgi:hypothetical protein